jgi:predicted nucleic acid-binding protein
MKLADAMIAATALEQNLTLVTRNVDDFKNIGILLFNPFETN